MNEQHTIENEYVTHPLEVQYKSISQGFLNTIKNTNNVESGMIEDNGDLYIYIKYKKSIYNVEVTNLGGEKDIGHTVKLSVKKRKKVENLEHTRELFKRIEKTFKKEYNVKKDNSGYSLNT